MGFYAYYGFIVLEEFRVEGGPNGGFGCLGVRGWECGEEKGGVGSSCEEEERPRVNCSQAEGSHCCSIPQFTPLVSISIVQCDWYQPLN